MRIDLLGFDVRRRSEDYAQADWDTARRNLYLLRPTVSSPSSVDPVVWPSVFDYAFPGSESAVSKEPTLRVAVTPSQVRLFALRLWPSTEEMRLAFSSSRGALTGIPIAVCLARGPSTPPDEFWDSVLNPALAESSLPSEWPRLGYDIADRYFISGLSNCGYLPDEAGQLRRRWASRINDHGLFEDLGDAELFRQLSERRVTEHSPFFIYAVYRAATSWRQPALDAASGKRDAPLAGQGAG